MTNVEKAIDRKYTPEEQRYAMKLSDSKYLYGRFLNSLFELMNAAFNYGFEKGKRYEKARRAKG